MSQPQPLNALDFPLHGSRLIEASAGTGKTYTIAALYVRLVLAHGGAQAFAKPLLPPDILVVTFTDAATRELRDRIRARLVEAAQVFREQAQPDPFLAGLRDSYAAADWAGCATRLDAAAQWMDESAIQTIHGWCQRMLHEHAFASGSLFDQEVQTRHSPLYRQVVRDYWRLHCYALDSAGVRWVREHWGTPDGLWNLLSRAVQATEVELPASDSQASLQQVLQRSQAEFERQLTALKQPWQVWTAELRQLAFAAIESKQVDGRKMKAGTMDNWLNQLQAWCDDPQALELGLTTSAINRLTPDGWSECWKDGHQAPDHPALTAMQTLPQQLKSLKAGQGDSLLWHAAHWVRERFAQEKRLRSEIGFNDMLLNLRQALASSQGEALAAIVRGQFPVALIDEFQDTDPVQYEIFNRIYRLEDNDEQSGLFLIGDPKQAIYSFRGADIHTYLKARTATTGRHYSLDTNYRSSQAMVDAVNAVFTHGEQHCQRGAFMFRRNDGDNPLPFVSVRANGRKEVWSHAGQPLPALTYWQLPVDDSGKGLSKSAYQAQMADICASEMVRLLNDGDTGYLQADGSLQRVAPSDMAVLVRNRHEAAAIRQALLLRQVRSVYLSDSDSVYASQEALDIQLWLGACLQPDDERALKAALASSTLGLSLAELDTLQQDELAWEQSVLRFRGYQQLWHQQGVLPMLRQLMHDYQLPQRLVRQLQGERALTNLLHLSEVLQQASRELDGLPALLEFLQQAHADPGGAGDEQVLRLESDAALVRVVTIHKSKGLEYPLVFLPFICSYREASPERGAMVTLGGERSLCTDPDQPGLAEQLDDERLAEDLRLYYVALTRARHACWLGMAQLNQAAGRSAPGYLQAGIEPAQGAENEAGDPSQWLDAPTPDSNCWQEPAPDFSPVCRAAPSLRHESWWVASYSALGTRGVHVTAPDSQAAQVLQDDEPDQPDEPSRPQLLAGIHLFPRGARPGTFLHLLLERVLQPALLQDAPARSRLLRDLCHGRGYGSWHEVLEGWLEQLLTTRFQLPNAADFSLATLDNWQNEMEFWFASHQAASLPLDRLVQQHILPGQRRPALLPQSINGLFKGFIDLVFVQDGRYYLADYKSNWLGGTAAAYSTQAMDACVLKHRYDLQYALYSLALHRLLRSRLPDYDYDRHVGGVAYLFLRGIEGPQQGVHFVKPPLALIEQLDALFANKETV